MSLGLTAGESAPFRDRQELVVREVEARLRGILATSENGNTDLQRLARRKLRELPKHAAEAVELKHLTEMHFRIGRVGSFAFARPEISQEEVAEHLKRLRNDHCAGTFRDTFNRFVPQPAGPRRAILRFVEPLAMHEWTGTAEAAMQEVRKRMQAKLDEINDGLTLRTEPNPFVS